MSYFIDKDNLEINTVNAYVISSMEQGLLPSELLTGINNSLIYNKDHWFYQRIFEQYKISKNKMDEFNETYNAHIIINLLEQLNLFQFTSRQQQQKFIKEIIEWSNVKNIKDYSAFANIKATILYWSVQIKQFVYHNFPNMIEANKLELNMLDIENIMSQLDINIPSEHIV